ncbi:translocation/assembly module TamB domain-containing protein [Enhygromyxa salina]|uniref:translocation/assembly module TamB domain-containing protein n=1 Tax=Enhygromyxa salina TaxID=215803 RepID=UPI0015E5B6FC|nr:translocation/assembly module TamB [Enhygromyxa salina]
MIAVLVVAWVPAASQRVTRVALERWGAGIPGEVEWEGMRGSFGAGLELEGFELRDGEGRPLIRARSLMLDLGMARLLRAEAELERVEAEGLEVWVDHDWSALAAPSEEPAEPSEGIGPELPVRIAASLRIADAAIYLDEELLVSNEELAVSLAGYGRSARVELELVGTELPQQQLRVDTLGLALSWDEPAAELERLELETSLGRVRTLGPAHFDAETTRGELELELEGEVEALAERLEIAELAGLDAALVRVRVEGEVEAERVELSVVGSAGPETTLELAAELAPVDEAGQRRAGLSLEGQLAAGLLHPEQGPLTVTLDAGLVQMPAGEVEATVELQVDDRRADASLTLEAGGRATSLSTPRGSAWLELRGPALEVSAAAASTDARPLDASWSVAVSELGRPLGLAAPYLDEPRLAEVRGALALTGGCASEVGGELERARCPIALELDRVAGFDLSLSHASLTAELTPLAEPLEFEAELALEGLRHPQVELDEAALRVAGTPAKIAVEGRGQGRHERFEIAAGVELAGTDTRVELDELALVSSRGAAPVGVALLDPARITIGSERIAVAGLRAAAFGGAVAVDGHVGLAGHASDLSVALRGIELGRVDAVIPGLHSSGRIDLEGALQGSLDQPSAWARVGAEGLTLGGHRIGELQLAANLCGAASDGGGRRGQGFTDASPPPTWGRCGRGSQGELQLWLRNAGPIADAVELDARVPLRFGDRPGLRARSELEARVLVRDLALVELGGLMPSTPSWWRQVPLDAHAPSGDPRLIPEGRVNLELSVSGSSSAPEIELRARASELVVDRTELGALTVHALLGDAGLELDLDAALTQAQIKLDAALPVRLDLARPAFAWDRGSEHAVELALVGLELDELQRSLGPKIPALAEALAEAALGGRVSATVRAHGPGSDPTLSASVRGEGLVYRGARLGDARVELGLGGGAATGTVALDGPLARRLDARVELPVELALASTPTIEFDTRAQLSAEAHVHAVELATLEQIVGGLPVDGLGDLDLRVRGSLADPKVELAARLADLQVEDDSAGDLTVYARVDRRRARVESDLVRRGVQLLGAEVEVPLIVELGELERAQLGWDRGGVHRVSARGRGLDPELLGALLGQPIAERELDADLRFDLRGAGTASDFELSAELDGQVAAEDELELDIHAALALDQAHQELVVAVDPVEQTPTLGEGGVYVAASLDAEVPRLLAGELTLGEVPFTLEVDAPELELDWLDPLVAPALHDPRGTLRAELSGSGVLAAPQLAGSLALHDGALTVLALRQRLTDIELELGLDGQVVELRTLSLGAGRGQISGEGRASFDPGTGRGEAKIGIALADFPIVRPGLPAMTIDTKAAIEVELAEAATRVRVALAESEVAVAGIGSSAPKSIPSDASVTFVGAPEPEPSVEPAVASVAPVGPELDLRLAFVDPLLITGQSIDMTWSGALRATRRGAGIEVGGELEADRGHLELLGHRFELRRGIVNLADDGSVDPFLDIIAETSTPEAAVSVTIRGRASRPELHFSSSPPLREYQILTLLVTGSTELGEGEGEVQTQAASLLAAVSSPQLQQQLDRYLGIDRAKLGFGDSLDQPILTVGKRVSSKVWVETSYHHNAPEDENTAEVGIEYNFAPSWTLETFFGDAAVGGVGVYWTHSFGPIEWRSRPADPPSSPD